MSLGCALALPLVTSLLSAASVHGDAEVRAETRTSTIVSTGVPALTRESAIVQPRLEGRVDDEALRVGAGYQARIWTSDLAGSSSLLVDHTVTAGVETRREGAWRGGVLGTAVRGKTDPLADLLASARAPASGQLPTTAPLSYESYRAAGRAELQLAPRSTAGATGSWSYSQGTDAIARALLPPQNVASAGLDTSHLVTVRDTLRVAADGTWSVTNLAGHEVQGGYSTGSASWRRRLSLTVDGWVGGGASLTVMDRPGQSRDVSVLPYVLVGLARAGDETRAALEATARLSPTVDRFTGAVESTAEFTASARWRPVRPLTLAATASAGAWTSGQMALGTWNFRATWALRDRLSLEAGVIGRWQRDFRPGIPSFVESGGFLAVTYGTGVGGP